MSKNNNNFRLITGITLSPAVLALFGLVCTNLFWAGNIIVARFSINDIPPVTLVFGRWLLTFIVLLPFAYPHIKDKWNVIKENKLLIVVLGFMGVTIYNTILYIAAHSTVALNISLVSSILPLITFLFTWLLMASRPSVWQILGMIVAMMGLLIVISEGEMQRLLDLQFNRGDVLMFALCSMWALYSVFVRKYPMDLHPTALLTVLVAGGLPFLAILFIIEIIVLPPFSLTVSSIPLFLYTAIFASILAYIFWNNGVQVLGPNVAAVSSYLMPLFTAILAILILDENMYWFHLLGAFFILLGLYLAVLYKPKAIKAKT